MRISKKYWQIAKRLTTAQLQKDQSDSSYFTEQDLFNVDIGRRGHDFFLGYYSHEGLKLVIEKYGVFDMLKSMGFKQPSYTINTDDPYVHKLTVYDAKRMLVEVVLKRDTFNLSMPFPTELEGKRINTLAIEWMSMQNPDAEFEKSRPKLPGQQYPGLGIASKAVEILMIAAWRLKLAGLLNTPQYYHNAFLYSRIFFCLDPNQQALLQALSRDTKKYQLSTVAWALEWGAIFEEKQDTPFRWEVTKQIVPLDGELKKLFNSWDYRKLVKKLAQDYKFRLDEDKFIKKKKIKEDQ